MAYPLSEYDREPCRECGRPRHGHTGAYNSIEGVCLGFTTVPIPLDDPPPVPYTLWLPGDEV